MKISLPQGPMSASTTQVACAACALKQFCLAAAALPPEHSPPTITVNRRRLRCGQTLYARGDAHAALFAVRAGFLKSCAPLPGGQRQVLGFHIMGDVLGLDALGCGVHRSDAVALNGCEVCELSLPQAERLMESRVAIALHLRALLSEQLAIAGERIVALGAMSARQRVASCLLDLALRWAGRGYSPNEFDLCLSRKEMGSYLGLTFETVSRMLSDFGAHGWIAVDGRKVRILDRSALQSQLARA
ncbi:MAG: helix-turn-helix domain-containing protein [Usitatibacter sp.]